MEVELPYLEGGPDGAVRPWFRGSPILARGRCRFARTAHRAATACRLNPGDGAGDQSLTVRQIRAVLAYAA